MGSGGGKVGRREGAGHERARVWQPVGAGTSSVTTVGGGPPRKGWEPLQYANTLWEFNSTRFCSKTGNRVPSAKEEIGRVTHSP